MSRNKLYSLLSIACLAGYSWLFFQLVTPSPEKSFGYSGCIIKHVTTIPCPSCGSTRSILSLLHGDVLGALYLNPLGFLIFGILLVVPFWLIYDILTKRESLHTTFRRTELLVRKKWIALPLILLFLGNWVWNIIKEI